MSLVQSEEARRQLEEEIRKKKQVLLRRHEVKQAQAVRTEPTATQGDLLTGTEHKPKPSFEESVAIAKQKSKKLKNYSVG